MLRQSLLNGGLVHHRSVSRVTTTSSVLYLKAEYNVSIPLNILIRNVIIW